MCVVVGGKFERDDALLALLAQIEASFLPRLQQRMAKPYIRPWMNQSQIENLPPSDSTVPLFEGVSWVGDRGISEWKQRGIE